MATSFSVNKHDLEFVLKQIKISEAHAEAMAGGATDSRAALLQAIADVYGISAADAALMPAGLRTVTGELNNLVEGREKLGAALTEFPRLLDPVYVTNAEGTIVFGPGAPPMSQGNYTPTPDGTGMSVVDTAPRTISNLIVDQTPANPAAIYAALKVAGIEGLDATDAVSAITAAYRAWQDSPVTLPAPTPGELDARDALEADMVDLIESYGLELTSGGALVIQNLSPDIGLSPSFNSYMTIFGQFFDHGLDLVNKGGNGTIYIPLEADDPLIAGEDGIFGTADDLPAHLQFMTLTRATQTIDENGVAQHMNTTTPYVDQNQTYTSHPSHQVFLREYVRLDIGDGEKAYSTGHLLDGTAATGTHDGAIATWFDTKVHALEMLGIRLDDADVHSVPLLLTDDYGNLILGPNGYAQMVMAPDGTHSTVWLQEGTAAGITTDGAVSSGVAFLVDIAHNAVPVTDGTGALMADADSDIGNAVANDGMGHNTEYDNELLDLHFLSGDGRGNENFGLTAVHSVFHAEHNRIVEVDKLTILESGDRAFINEWLLVDIAEGAPIPTDPADLIWDGERLFQAGRFSTEMQYQHMVFEEFARRVQPMVDPFVFTNTADVDPSIMAEFAHTVYRFGHSMLTDTVDRIDNNLNPVVDPTTGEQSTLIAAFLNPMGYVGSGETFDEAQANIIRGLTQDVGSEIDEFVVPALRSNLLGLPLDLAALNIARGRDTGIPSLNETRFQLYNDFGIADLKPYESWSDFAQNIKNPASLVNFIAAYGTHSSIVAATTLEEKRDAAMELVFGVDVDGSGGVATDRLDYLNSTGVWSGFETGLNDVDLWIGGLAEQINEFGGMLGSTFNFLFEYQMEVLQNGDRFYYLSRVQGLNMLDSLEANSFTDIVMRNSALGGDYAPHLNAVLFVTPDAILELDRGIAQQGADPIWGDLRDQFAPKVIRDYTGASQIDVDGVMHDVGGTLHYRGGEHVVLGGTEGNDTLTGDKGIDALWGDGGDDYLNAGMESDQVFGGDGDDIIEDPFGDNFLRGERGNDVVSAARGFNLLFGGEGEDAMLIGQDAGESFGGEGNDFILGGSGVDFLLGNEGDDWLEGGEGFDTIAGDNSELFFNSTIIGHDVAWGQGNDQDYDLESGDDIAFTGPGVQRFEGMFGFDWAIGKYDPNIDVDMEIPIFTSVPANILRDRFDLMEGFSGWKNDDIIRGDNRGQTIGGAIEVGAVIEEGFDEHVLTQEGIDRIDGLNEWFGDARQTLFPTSDGSFFRDGNILLGGGGDDLIQGKGGNDLIDGDSWLNVRIRIEVDGVEYSAESMNGDKLSAGPFAGKVFNVDALGNPDFGNVAFGGRSLVSLLLDRTIKPSEMHIVREILRDTTPGDDDTAVYFGTLAEYEIEGRGLMVGGVMQDAFDINGDGFISVRDLDDGATGAIVGGVQLATRGKLTDGTDLLKGIEKLQFADQTVSIEIPLPTDIVWTPAGLPGNALPGVGETIAQLSADQPNATFALLSGSGFAVSASGAVVATGGLGAGETHALQLAATGIGGTYVEDVVVQTGTFGNDVVDGTSGVTDIFYMSNGQDTVTGGDGDDVIFGQAHDDSLDGGIGNDIIVGGRGNDITRGGNGADTFLVDIFDGIDTIDGEAGSDTLEISGTSGVNLLTVSFDGSAITSIGQIGTISSIENVTLDLGGGLDSLSYVPTTAGVSVDLAAGIASGFAVIAGIERVYGTDQADSLTSGTGTETLIGRGGDDVFVLTSDALSDRIMGGAGSDTADYASAITALSVDLSVANTVVMSGSGVSAATDDRLILVENLIGGSAGDSFTGRGGTTVLEGRGGNDTLNGHNGADTLDGGDGNDVLIGGNQADVLIGGADDDTFVFTTFVESSVAANDVIVDFEGAGLAGGDLIDLSAFGATFIGGGAFAAGAGNQIRVIQDGTDTLIQIDVDNDVSSESQIRLTGLHALTADDFIL